MGPHDTPLGLLHQRQGTLLLLAYGLLFAAAGSYFLTRQDIT